MNIKHLLSTLTGIILLNVASYSQCGGLTAGNNGSGTYTMTGSCSITGTVSFAQTGGAKNLVVPNGTTLNITGDLNQQSSGTITVEAGGTLIIDGDFVNGKNGTINLNGDVTVTGSFSNLGNGSIGADGSVSIEGDFNNTGNNGDIAIGGGFNVGGTLTNDGGDITVEDGAVLKAETLVLDGNGGVDVQSGGTFATDNPIGGGGSGTVTSDGTNGDTDCTNGCCGTQCTNDGTQLNDGGNETLPVDLLYFIVDATSTGIDISWSTATELNNDKFLVERSYDGINFDVVTTIDGSGTTNEKKEYDYNDRPAAEGAIYYRLTQVDYDGQFEQFEIVRVIYDPIEIPNKRVYPNPIKSNEVLYIDDFVGFIHSVNITLVDLSGKQKKLSSISTSRGRIEVEMPQVKKGTYFLKAEINGTELTRRIVVK